MADIRSLRTKVEKDLLQIGGDFGNPEQVQYYIDALNELAGLYL